MGFLDRIHDLATATGGALWAPVGFTKDVVFALPELGTLDFPGFAHDTFEAFKERGGDAVAETIGPAGIGGTLIGAIPEGARGELQGPLNLGTELMTTAYDELVSQPLSTAVTAATFAKTDGVDALFQPKTLAEAYNIAEHRSPGQSLALAFLTHDIRDPAQIRKAQATDWYQVISGTTDAVANIVLDPTALALGGITKAATGARALDSAANLARLERVGAVDAFVDDIVRIGAEHGDGAAAVVRQTHFPHHQFGAQISDLLTNADKLPPGLVGGLDGPAATKRVLRILMGATDEVQILKETRPDLAGQIERLSEHRTMLKQTLNGDELAATDLADIDNELDSLYALQNRVERLDDVTATIRSLPRVAGPVSTRGRIATGDYYQSSPFTRPVREITMMEPHPMVHLDDPTGDIQIFRMLQKTDLPIETQHVWRSRYMAAATPQARMQVLVAAEEDGVRSIAEAAGMSPDELRSILAEANRGRTAAKRRIDSRRYDGAGRSRITIEDENGAIDHIIVQEYPLYETQLPNLHPIVDMDRVRDATKPIKRFLERNPGYPIATDMLQTFADVWKPSVLIRIGFPIRNLTDEALRSMAKIGVLSTVHNLGQGGVDYVAQALKKIGFTEREIDGFVIGNHAFEGPFGAPGDGAQLYRKLINGRQTYGSLVSADEGKILDDLIQSGPWRTVDPSEVSYPAAWEHAVNNQIGRSELGQRMLEDMGVQRIRREIPLEEIPEPDLLVKEGISNEFIRGDTINDAGRALLNNDEAAIAHVHDLIDQSIEHRLRGAITEADQADLLGPDSTLRNIEREMDPSALSAEGHAAIHAEAEAALDQFFYDKLVEQQGHPYANVPPGARFTGEIVPREPLPQGRRFEHQPPRSRDEVIARTVNWLETTPEGQTLKRSLPERSKRALEEWVGAVYDQIDAYLPTDELKGAAWGGFATHDMLVKALPTSSSRPLVHGGVVEDMLGGPIRKAWRGFVNKSMEHLVAKPSNYLIRNRFFDHMYHAEVTRQVRLLTGEAEMSLPERMRNLIAGETSHSAHVGLELDAEDIANIERRSRRYALNETRRMFDNFAEQYSMAKHLGMLAPFANAWGQIASTWAGLVIENPAFARRMQLIWRSPEKAGLVTDGAGNVVDEEGRIVTPAPNTQYRAGDPAADGQRNVTLSLPSWVQDIPGLRNVGEFKFSKDSINMLLHGLPSVGPMVQVGVNEIAKARPDLEKSLRWALPYGVTANSLDILKPTLVRRLETQSEGDANRTYAYTVMRIYTDRLVDWNLGKREKRPTWEEAKDEANNFWHMRTVASFVLPVTPQFSSPYQPYIDAYRARRDFDAQLTAQQKQLPSYETPDEWFLKKFGEEFFPLTASMSKSIDGIPPTIAGRTLHEEHAKLIAKYPELGSLIVGAEGAGEFSRSVYESQFASTIGPGSRQRERVVMPYEEFEVQASAKLGWIEFSRVMDVLDAMRIQRGLASFQVKGAEDLAQMKAAAIEFLATNPKYDGWYEDYSDSDSLKWEKRINGMTAILADKKIKEAERPEFIGLQKYLDGRKDVVAALEGLGTKRLDSKLATPIRDAWQAYIGYLVDQYPAFGALYNRWLDNDPVNLTPVTAQAQAGALA